MLTHIDPILLVEDDPNDAFFVRHALETARIQNPLRVFTSGEQACEHLRLEGGSHPPVLVVLDLHLAGGTGGLDVLAWIRQQSEPLGSTPALILTGSDRQEDRDEGRRLGAMLYLQKPVTEENLTRAVQALGFVVVNNLTAGHLGLRIIERR